MISIAVMADLQDGRSESLSLDLQTRHGDSRRPLTLKGALRGLPAEGGGRDYGLDRRGRLSPHNHLSDMHSQNVGLHRCLTERRHDPQPRSFLRKIMASKAASLAASSV